MNIDFLVLRSNIPKTIGELDGCCGPVSAWMVLKYFNKKVSPTRTINCCRHSKKNGTFMICLATGLHKLGLQVSFYTQPDDSPHYWEKQSYKTANRIGMTIAPAISLRQLLTRVNKNCVAIVLYEGSTVDAHISPLIGHDERGLFLPYEEGGGLPIKDFKERWNAPGILSQCILVSN